MDTSRKLLRIATALTLVLGASSLLIFSVKYKPAFAQTPKPGSGIVPIRIIHRDLQHDGTPVYLIHVIGYTADGMEKDKIKVIAKEWVKR